MEPQSHPAELVEVLYLLDVTAPDFKVGKKGETKSVERHWADQLVLDGYCEFAKGQPQAHVSPADHADLPHHVDS